MSDVPQSIAVRMSHAGRLHLCVVGTNRMLCGLPTDGSKSMRAETWDRENLQFKCRSCAKKQDHREPITIHKGKP